ncbi:hypothetical protein [Saccharopolyspora karakumensis]|nr:hypothetical protein [Saccharopolyspora karakumensis]
MSQNLHRTRRRAHVLFVSIPAHGHINPGLGLVAELAGRGHRVSYATTDEFTPQVIDSVLNRSATTPNCPAPPALSGRSGRTTR